MSKKRIKELKVEEHVIREIKLQTYFTHCHLTSLYGYFHDETHLYLILELLPDGSLQQVKKKKKLPEKEAADIVRQTALGLKCMHQEYVIHRDLKPENLFLNEVFGLLRRVTSRSGTSAVRFTTTTLALGTPSWAVWSILLLSSCPRKDTLTRSTPGAWAS